MARSKKSLKRIEQETQRLTWTLFHLPSTTAWPKWSDEYSISAIGPLMGVAGCKKVLLGRQVQDSEQAVFIIRKCLRSFFISFSRLIRHLIVWSSAEALEEFEASPACDGFLRDLQAERTSPPQLFTLRYDVGFDLEDYLHGRITLTLLYMCASASEEEKHHVKRNGFAGFVPAGSEDLMGPPWHQRMPFTVSARERQLQEPHSSTGDLHYVFYRWHGNGGTPERENASAHDAEAQKSWADAVAQISPPVSSWEQQRWQIHAAPGYAEEIEDDARFEGFLAPATRDGQIADGFIDSPGI